MKTKMKKKYFMKSSNEELQFGDMLELNFSKETKDGKLEYQHMECKFLPEIVDLLLEEDIIREEDVKEDDNNEENTLLDFPDDTPYTMLTDIVEAINELTSKLGTLTSEVVNLQKILQSDAKSSRK